MQIYRKQQILNEKVEKYLAFIIFEEQAVSYPVLRCHEIIKKKTRGKLRRLHK
jgi:hypothetical protein